MAKDMWCAQQKRGWCALKGRPDKDALNDATVCDRYVILSGGYQLRQPTCPDCLEVLYPDTVARMEDCPECSSRGTNGLCNYHAIHGWAPPKPMTKKEAEGILSWLRGCEFQHENHHGKSFKLILPEDLLIALERHLRSMR